MTLWSKGGELHLGNTGGASEKIDNLQSQEGAHA